MSVVPSRADVAGPPRQARFCADIVAKVENREAPKISRMSNLGDLSRGKAL